MDALPFLPLLDGLPFHCETGGPGLSRRSQYCRVLSSDKSLRVRCEPCSLRRSPNEPFGAPRAIRQEISLSFASAERGDWKELSSTLSGQDRSPTRFSLFSPHFAFETSCWFKTKKGYKGVIGVLGPKEQYRGGRRDIAVHHTDETNPSKKRPGLARPWGGCTARLKAGAAQLRPSYHGLGNQIKLQFPEAAAFPLVTDSATGLSSDHR